MTGIPAGALASPGQRIAAYAIDFVVLAVPVVPLTIWLSEFDSEGGMVQAPAGIAWWSSLLWLLYEVVLTARDGQTVGKKLIRTRVVRRDTQKVPPLRAVLLRAVPLHVLGMLPVVGTVAAVAAYIPIMWRPDRRGLHDFMAGTVVIRSDY